MRHFSSSSSSPLFFFFFVQKNLRESEDSDPNRERDHDRDLQAQAEPLGSGSFHGVSWRDRDIESNDLVNHIGGVFRYFIVDVVDPESTPDVARCDRELEHRLIDSWSPRLEEERHMQKLPIETEETRKVKEIFGLQEKKKNCWTFFAAAAQVYGGRIHESVESVEMISSYEIRVSLEFSRGARICYCVRRTSGYSQDKMVAGC
ncbi:hypothetical protein F2Q68_00007775 [Brassica cretica]|uniref:Uncharacterized protein n=1 Tax=Brassica cretica TaxID=69181 RepID=A0A8S9L1E1_BRACR|nr:hypothetical protein F2Q68_00007775 [Brassica cretica]